jgi:hypothetical protein
VDSEKASDLARALRVFRARLLQKVASFDLPVFSFADTASDNLVGDMFHRDFADSLHMRLLHDFLVDNLLHCMTVGSSFVGRVAEEDMNFLNNRCIAAEWSDHNFAADIQSSHLYAAAAVVEAKAAADCLASDMRLKSLVWNTRSYIAVHRTLLDSEFRFHGKHIDYHLHIADADFRILCTTTW